MTVTIKQIAEHSGLSIQTVSQILNDKAGAYKPDTRERVRTAARELGYLPNSSARAMRSGLFGGLALLSSTEGTRSLLPVGLLDGIYDEAASRNMHLIFARMSDEQLTSDRFTPKILRELMADGLLINYNAHIPPGMIARIEQQAMPAVWINTKQPTDCVFPDDLRAGQRAAEHLLALGHRRIGFVNWNSWAHYSAQDRWQGVQNAVQAAGLELMTYSLDERLELRDLPVATAALKQIRAQGVTAVITYARESARLLFDAAALTGVAIPRDLSVVNFTDIDDFMLGLQLDAMLLPEYEMGRAAVTTLMQKIGDRACKTPPQPFAYDLKPGQTAIPLTAIAV